MGLPRFSYNGKNIDVTEDVSVLPWDPQLVGTFNRSVSGHSETLSHRSDVLVSVAWELLASAGISDTERKRQFRQLAQWIQAGYPFTFARDHDKTVNTTLANAVLKDASTVVVASATGITIGDEYVIRDKDRVETVRVDNVASTTITLRESLNFGFAAGARFRYVEFWPARAVPGARLIKESPPLHFGVSFDFMEDVNGL